MTNRGGGPPKQVILLLLIMVSFTLFSIILFRRDMSEVVIERVVSRPQEEKWLGEGMQVYSQPRTARTTITLPNKDEDVRYFPSNHFGDKKYFVYQPSGGWGNQRYILRWAIIVANAMGRTLVVSPLAPHSDIWHGYNEWNKDQVLAADLVLDVKALNQAVNKGVVFINDTPARVMQRIANETKLTSKVFVKGHYTSNLRKKLLIYKESEISMNWGNVKEDVVFWDKMSMWQCCVTDFLPDSVWYGRHIIFNEYFKSLALRLVKGFYPFNAVHVRRGDMTISKDRKTAEVYYRAHHLESFDKSPPLYVATNENDATWFDAWLEPGRFTKLVYWKDLDVQAIERELEQFPASMKGDVLGFIEQLICGNAVKWEGSKKSTFSATISSIRVAPQLREIEWSFPPKPSIRMGKAAVLGDQISSYGNLLGKEEGEDFISNDEG